MRKSKWIISVSIVLMLVVMLGFVLSSCELGTPGGKTPNSGFDDDSKIIVPPDDDEDDPVIPPPPPGDEDDISYSGINDDPSDKKSSIVISKSALECYGILIGGTKTSDVQGKYKTLSIYMDINLPGEDGVVSLKRFVVRTNLDQVGNDNELVIKLVDLSNIPAADVQSAEENDEAGDIVNDNGEVVGALSFSTGDIAEQVAFENKGKLEWALSVVGNNLYLQKETTMANGELAPVLYFEDFNMDYMFQMFEELIKYVQDGNYDGNLSNWPLFQELNEALKGKVDIAGLLGTIIGFIAGSGQITIDYDEDGIMHTEIKMKVKVNEFIDKTLGSASSIVSMLGGTLPFELNLAPLQQFLKEITPSLNVYMLGATTGGSYVKSKKSINIDGLTTDFMGLKAYRDDGRTITNDEWFGRKEAKSELMLDIKVYSNTIYHDNKIDIGIPDRTYASTSFEPFSLTNIAFSLDLMLDSQGTIDIGSAVNSLIGSPTLPEGVIIIDAEVGLRAEIALDLDLNYGKETKIDSNGKAVLVDKNMIALELYLIDVQGNYLLDTDGNYYPLLSVYYLEGSLYANLTTLDEDGVAHGVLSNYYKGSNIKIELVGLPQVIQDLIGKVAEAVDGLFKNTLKVDNWTSYEDVMKQVYGDSNNSSSEELNGSNEDNIDAQNEIAGALEEETKTYSSVNTLAAGMDEEGYWHLSTDVLTIAKALGAIVGFDDIFSSKDYNNTDPEEDQISALTITINHFFWGVLAGLAGDLGFDWPAGLIAEVDVQFSNEGDMYGLSISAGVDSRSGYVGDDNYWYIGNKAAFKKVLYTSDNVDLYTSSEFSDDTLKKWTDTRVDDVGLVDRLDKYSIVYVFNNTLYVADKEYSLCVLYKNGDEYYTDPECTIEYTFEDIVIREATEEDPEPQIKKDLVEDHLVLEVINDVVKYDTDKLTEVVIGKTPTLYYEPSYKEENNETKFDGYKCKGYAYVEMAFLKGATKTDVQIEAGVLDTVSTSNKRAYVFKNQWVIGTGLDDVDYVVAKRASDATVIATEGITATIAIHDIMLCYRADGLAKYAAYKDSFGEGSCLRKYIIAQTHQLTKVALKDGNTLGTYYKYVPGAGYEKYVGKQDEFDPEASYYAITEKPYISSVTNLIFDVLDGSYLSLKLAVSFGAGTYNLAPLISMIGLDAMADKQLLWEFTSDVDLDISLNVGISLNQDDPEQSALVLELKANEDVYFGSERDANGDIIEPKQRKLMWAKGTTILGIYGDGNQVYVELSNLYILNITLPNLSFNLDYTTLIYDLLGQKEIFDLSFDISNLLSGNGTTTNSTEVAGSQELDPDHKFDLSTAVGLLINKDTVQLAVTMAAVQTLIEALGFGDNIPFDLGEAFDLAIDLNLNRLTGSTLDISGALLPMWDADTETNIYDYPDKLNINLQIGTEAAPVALGDYNLRNKYRAKFDELASQSQNYYDDLIGAILNVVGDFQAILTIDASTLSSEWDINKIIDTIVADRGDSFNIPINVKFDEWETEVKLVLSWYLDLKNFKQTQVKIQIVYEDNVWIGLYIYQNSIIVDLKGIGLIDLEVKNVKAVANLGTALTALLDNIGDLSLTGLLNKLISENLTGGSAAGGGEAAGQSEEQAGAGESESSEISASGEEQSTDPSGAEDPASGIEDNMSSNLIALLLSSISAQDSVIFVHIASNVFETLFRELVGFSMYLNFEIDGSLDLLGGKLDLNLGVEKTVSANVSLSIATGTRGEFKFDDELDLESIPDANAMKGKVLFENLFDSLDLSLYIDLNQSTSTLGDDEAYTRIYLEKLKSSYKINDNRTAQAGSFFITLASIDKSEFENSGTGTKKPIAYVELTRDLQLHVTLGKDLLVLVVDLADYINIDINLMEEDEEEKAAGLPTGIEKLYAKLEELLDQLTSLVNGIISPEEDDGKGTGTDSSDDEDNQTTTINGLETVGVVNGIKIVSATGVDQFISKEENVGTIYCYKPYNKDDLLNEQFFIVNGVNNKSELNKHTVTDEADIPAASASLANHVYIVNKSYNYTEEKEGKTLTRYKEDIAYYVCRIVSKNEYGWYRYDAASGISYMFGKLDITSLFNMINVYLNADKESHVGVLNVDVDINTYELDSLIDNLMYYIFGPETILNLAQMTANNSRDVKEIKFDKNYLASVYWNRGEANATFNSLWKQLPDLLQDILDSIGLSAISWMINDGTLNIVKTTLQDLINKLIPFAIFNESHLGVNIVRGQLTSVYFTNEDHNEAVTKQVYNEETGEYETVAYKYYNGNKDLDSYYTAGVRKESYFTNIFIENVSPAVGKTNVIGYYEYDDVNGNYYYNANTGRYVKGNYVQDGFDDDNNPLYSYNKNAGNYVYIASTDTYEKCTYVKKGEGAVTWDSIPSTITYDPYMYASDSDDDVYTSIYNEYFKDKVATYQLGATDSSNPIISRSDITFELTKFYAWKLDASGKGSYVEEANANVGTKINSITSLKQAVSLSKPGKYIIKAYANFNQGTIDQELEITFVVRSDAAIDTIDMPELFVYSSMPAYIFITTVDGLSRRFDTSKLQFYTKTDGVNDSGIVTLYRYVNPKSADGSWTQVVYVKFPNGTEQPTVVKYKNSTIANTIIANAKDNEINIDLYEFVATKVTEDGSEVVSTTLADYTPSTLYYKYEDQTAAYIKVDRWITSYTENGVTIDANELFRRITAGDSMWGNRSAAEYKITAVVAEGTWNEQYVPIKFIVKSKEVTSIVFGNDNDKLQVQPYEYYLYLSGDESYNPYPDTVTVNYDTYSEEVKVDWTWTNDDEEPTYQYNIPAAVERKATISLSTEYPAADIFMWSRENISVTINRNEILNVYFDDSFKQTTLTINPYEYNNLKDKHSFFPKEAWVEFTNGLKLKMPVAWDWNEIDSYTVDYAADNIQFTMAIGFNTNDPYSYDETTGVYSINKFVYRRNNEDTTPFYQTYVVNASVNVRQIENVFVTINDDIKNVEEDILVIDPVSVNYEGEDPLPSKTNVYYTDGGFNQMTVAKWTIFDGEEEIDIKDYVFPMAGAKNLKGRMYLTNTVPYKYFDVNIEILNRGSSEMIVDTSSITDHKINPYEYEILSNGNITYKEFVDELSVKYVTGYTLKLVNNNDSKKTYEEIDLDTLTEVSAYRRELRLKYNYSNGVYYYIDSENNTIECSLVSVPNYETYVLPVTWELDTLSVTGQGGIQLINYSFGSGDFKITKTLAVEFDAKEISYVETKEGNDYYELLYKGINLTDAQRGSGKVVQTMTVHFTDGTSSSVLCQIDLTKMKIGAQSYGFTMGSKTPTVYTYTEVSENLFNGTTHTAGTYYIKGAYTKVILGVNDADYDSNKNYYKFYKTVITVEGSSYRVNIVDNSGKPVNAYYDESLHAYTDSYLMDYATTNNVLYREVNGNFFPVSFGDESTGFRYGSNLTYYFRADVSSDAATKAGTYYTYATTRTRVNYNNETVEEDVYTEIDFAGNGYKYDYASTYYEVSVENEFTTKVTVGYGAASLAQSSTIKVRVVK